MMGIEIKGNAILINAKNKDLFCIIDLSGLQPGEMPAELFVIKLKNAL